MNPSTLSRNGPAWLACSALLCGCSTFSYWRSSATRSAPLPTPSDSFLLPPEGTDVVGIVQIASAHHEDTLSDIARRYDLGYEEIVAANPGEGTRVVLPTQFVLPDAPQVHSNPPWALAEDRDGQKVQ